MFGNFVGQFLGGWIRGLKDKFVFFFGGGVAVLGRRCSFFSFKAGIAQKGKGRVSLVHKVYVRH